MSTDTVHEVKRRVIDTFGVGIAAFTGEASKVARVYAHSFPNPQGCTVFGTQKKTNPDIAAFVNGIMARYLDFNDTYVSQDPSHPSDVILPLMTVAEFKGLTGEELITAITIAYEIVVSLCDAASLWVNKWDHVNYVGIAVAAATSRLFGLSIEATEQAIAMTAVPHAAMRQSRAGELSMWKGVAAANASRNAVFVTLLAERGMTGPSQPFAGRMGFFELLTHKPFDSAALSSMETKNPPERILDTHIKFWPAEYHSQSAIDVALQLRQEIGDPQRIDKIHIDTYHIAYEIIVREAEKWAPQTRETADHSLPFMVTVALEDGELTDRSFSVERIMNPTTRKIMKNRITVEVKPELNAGYPEGIPNRITITTKDGATFQKQIAYPRGHAKNPMTDDEVVEKFNKNTEVSLAPAQREQILEAVWSLEKLAQVSHLFPLLIV